MKTISDGLDQGSDNFLLLRFIAAVLVIYGHAPGITGGNGPPDLFFWVGSGYYSGSIAVDIFFVVSGFLVTGSYFRRRHLADFVWARLMRIVPAYALCLIFSAFLIGPLFTDLSVGEYLANREPYTYVWRNLLFHPDLLVWKLPGVFFENPKTQVVNGSIWTLPAEIRMYAWVGLLGLLRVFSRRWVFNVVFAAIVIYALLRPKHIPLVPLNDFVRVAGLFAIGAFCYINRSWIPIHGAILIAVFAIAYLCRSQTFFPYVFSICEALFVFWFAYNTHWWGFNRLGDYSYGVYLWGFPAQQMVAAVAGNLPCLLNATTGLAVALLFAIASWHLIEKPALKLKGIPSSLETRLRTWRSEYLSARKR